MSDVDTAVPASGLPALLRARFAAERDRAERALAQVPDAAFFAPIAPHAEPLAILVKHVGGNLRSRWTDVIASDGEKPDRHRDAEFVLAADDTRAALMRRWDAGWDACLGALGALAPADLARTVTIRAEPMPLAEAALRSLAHTAYHVGQIVFVAKSAAGDAWQTLSIPKGGSEAYLAAVRARHAAPAAGDAP